MSNKKKNRIYNKIDKIKNLWCKSKSPKCLKEGNRCVVPIISENNKSSPKPANLSKKWPNRKNKKWYLRKKINKTNKIISIKDLATGKAKKIARSNLKIWTRKTKKMNNCSNRNNRNSKKIRSTKISTNSSWRTSN